MNGTPSISPSTIKRICIAVIKFFANKFDTAPVSTHVLRSDAGGELVIIIMIFFFKKTPFTLPCPGIFGPIILYTLLRTLTALVLQERG